MRWGECLNCKGSEELKKFDKLKLYFKHRRNFQEITIVEKIRDLENLDYRLIFWVTHSVIYESHEFVAQFSQLSNKCVGLDYFSNVIQSLWFNIVALHSYVSKRITLNYIRFMPLTMMN